MCGAVGGGGEVGRWPRWGGNFVGNQSVKHFPLFIFFLCSCRWYVGFKKELKSLLSLPKLFCGCLIGRHFYMRGGNFYVFVSASLGSCLACSFFSARRWF